MQHDTRFSISGLGRIAMIVSVVIIGPPTSYSSHGLVIWRARFLQVGVQEPCNVGVAGGVCMPHACRRNASHAAPSISRLSGAPPQYSQMSDIAANAIESGMMATVPPPDPR
eukprot:15433361-Alexandrium_andersonii.AAC.1